VDGDLLIISRFVFNVPFIMISVSVCFSVCLFVCPSACVSQNRYVDIFCPC